jgi:hypothetical protein
MKTKTKKKKKLPEKFHQAILARSSAMEDGDYYDLVGAALVEHGYKFKSDISYNPDSGCRGKIFVRGKHQAAVSHADFLGEFTDLQFVV